MPKKKITSRVRLERQCAIPRLVPPRRFVPQDLKASSSGFNAGSAPLKLARVYIRLVSPLSLLVHAWLVPYRIKSLLAHLVFPLSHSDLPYVLTSAGTLSRFITGVARRIGPGRRGSLEQRWAVAGLAPALSLQILSMKGKILGIVLGRRKYESRRGVVISVRSQHHCRRELHRDYRKE